MPDAPHCEPDPLRSAFELLLAQFELRAKHWRNTPNDHHSVATAMMVAMSECVESVKDVLAKFPHPTGHPASVVEHRHHFENTLSIQLTSDIASGNQLAQILSNQTKIMATQAEHAAQLNAIGDKLDKATTEIVSAIQALKDAQASSGNTTPAEDAATARLDKVAQALDDINPDAPAP